MPDAIRTTFTILHIRTLCPVYVESSRAPPQCIPARSLGGSFSFSARCYTKVYPPASLSCPWSVPTASLLVPTGGTMATTATALAFVTACASGGTFSSDGHLRRSLRPAIPSSTKRYASSTTRAPSRSSSTTAPSCCSRPTARQCGGFTRYAPAWMISPHDTAERSFSRSPSSPLPAHSPCPAHRAQRTQL